MDETIMSTDELDVLDFDHIGSESTCMFCNNHDSKLTYQLEPNCLKRPKHKWIQLSLQKDDENMMIKEQCEYCNMQRTTGQTYCPYCNNFGFTTVEYIVHGDQPYPPHLL